jgi:hypothetical protein
MTGGTGFYRKEFVWTEKTSISGWIDPSAVVMC